MSLLPAVISFLEGADCIKYCIVDSMMKAIKQMQLQMLTVNIFIRKCQRQDSFGCHMEKSAVCFRSFSPSAALKARKREVTRGQSLRRLWRKMGSSDEARGNWSSRHVKKEVVDPLPDILAKKVVRILKYDYLKAAKMRHKNLQTMWK